MNDMQQRHNDIKKELEELEALHLKGWREDKPVHLPPVDLDEYVLKGVYARLAEERRENPVIDLHAGLRRSRGRGWSLAIRMVAGIAAIITLGTMAYRLMTPIPQQAKDCEGQDLLTCLSKETSEDDIYNYLMHEYPGSEDVYLFEAAHAPEKELTPIELQ